MLHIFYDFYVVVLLILGYLGVGGVSTILIYKDVSMVGVWQFILARARYLIMDPLC